MITKAWFYLIFGRNLCLSGLAKSVSLNNTIFPLRIWVVDNSGSMQKDDGNRIILSNSGNIKIAKCTRWEEIKECVEYHSQMAGLLEAETWFRVRLELSKLHFQVGNITISFDTLIFSFTITYISSASQWSWFRFGIREFRGGMQYNRARRRKRSSNCDQHYVEN